MTAIFLHPPFDRADILARVADMPVEARPATLADHEVRSDEHGLRVALVRGGEGVAGVLAEFEAAAGERMGFAMTALGAEPAEVMVATAEGSIEAVGYRFASDAPDGRLEPDAERLARLAETLDEVMGHFGVRPAAEMPALLYGIGVRALGRSRGAARRVETTLGGGLGAIDVELVARRHPYTRFFAIEEHRLRHRRFDGGVSDVLERAVFTSGDAVVVLPYDPRRDSLLLIEQFRTGPWARRDPRPWCLETVAGRCDRSESPEDAARREAREEAGLVLGRIERIGSFYPSPAIMSEFIVAFVGEADLDGAGGTFGLPEEHEDIRAQVVPRAAALAAMERGEIDAAPLMLALYWLECHADRLRAAWA